MWFPHLRCKRIETLLGASFVKYTKRAVFVDRVWKPNLDWVLTGRPSKWLNKTVASGPLQHIPIMARTDFIEQVDAILRSRNASLESRIEAWQRPVDVSHYWVNRTVPDHVLRKESMLRSRVNDIVFDLQDTLHINVVADLVGQAGEDGRRNVNVPYLESLLASKIFVVTQRDAWEDHYRLFEALVAGPLVFTDLMLRLPPGLENGTSLIEFAQAIARQGRHVAMSLH